MFLKIPDDRTSSRLLAECSLAAASPASCSHAHAGARAAATTSLRQSDAGRDQQNTEESQELHRQRRTGVERDLIDVRRRLSASYIRRQNASADVEFAAFGSQTISRVIRTTKAASPDAFIIEATRTIPFSHYNRERVVVNDDRPDFLHVEMNGRVTCHRILCLPVSRRRIGRPVSHYMP